MSDALPPPPPPPRPSPPSGWDQPPSYAPQAGWQYPPVPPGPAYGSAVPPYGYAPPPGWVYLAPNHATRLGLQFATFGQRLGAWLLDGLFLALISIPVWIVGIWWVASNWETELGRCTDARGFSYTCDVATDGSVGRLMLTLLLGGALMLVVSIFYWGKFEGERGQSPGQKVAGIRVVRQETGLPIGFGRAVGRMFAQYLSSQVLYLGYLWMLWDDDKQTWHDKIVSSIVVKE